MPDTESLPGRPVRAGDRGDHGLRPAGDRPGPGRAGRPVPAERPQPHGPGGSRLSLVHRATGWCTGSGCATAGRSGTATAGSVPRPSPRPAARRGRPARCTRGWISRPTRTSIASAGRTLATVESGPLPYELSDELDTVGPCDFGGTLPGGFAAHTKADPLTGELHAIAYYWAWDHVQHLVVGSGGRVTSATNIPLADGPMMHDFALTGQLRGAVRPAGHVQHGRRVGREKTALHLESRSPGPGRPAAPRRQRRLTSAGSRWTRAGCSTPSTPTTTTAAGWSSTCAATRAPTTCPRWTGRGPLTLDRWIVDPAAGKVTEQRLDDRLQEFPRVSDRVISRPHRYGYSAVIGEVSQGTVVAGRRLRGPGLRQRPAQARPGPRHHRGARVRPRRHRGRGGVRARRIRRRRGRGLRHGVRAQSRPRCRRPGHPGRPGFHRRARRPGAPARPDPARVPRQLDRRPLAGGRAAGPRAARLGTPDRWPAAPGAGRSGGAG